MNNDHDPNDIGVSTLTTAAPVIANALFAVSGVRTRNLPIEKTVRLI